VAVQQAHAREAWPDGVVVRLRIGLHTGEPAVGDEGYTGLDVVRASRLAAIGRGGQVLLSDTTRAIAANDLPAGVRMRSMGERTLRDIERPEPLTELVIPDVEVSDAKVDVATGDPDMPPDLPSWLSGPARRFLPGADRTRDMIERRVMDALTDAFEGRDAARAAARPRRRDRQADRTPVAPPAEAPTTGSVADEIDRLRALRDAGALNEEQYARAVDRVLGGPEKAG
jgi:hypothetical protein